MKSTYEIYEKIGKIWILREEHSNKKEAKDNITIYKKRLGEYKFMLLKVTRTICN